MQTKRFLTTDYTDCTDKEKSQKMRSSIISKSAKSVVEMIRMIFRLRISGLCNRVRGACIAELTPARDDRRNLNNELCKTKPPASINRPQRFRPSAPSGWAALFCGRPDRHRSGQRNPSNPFPAGLHSPHRRRNDRICPGRICFRREALFFQIGADRTGSPANPGTVRLERTITPSIHDHI